MNKIFYGLIRRAQLKSFDHSRGPVEFRNIPTTYRVCSLPLGMNRNTSYSRGFTEYFGESLEVACAKIKALGVSEEQLRDVAQLG